MLTPPNVCTLARILLVPLFVALWHASSHTAAGGAPHRFASLATAAVFIAAAATDWLDGYLARRVRCGGAVVVCCVCMRVCVPVCVGPVG